MTPPPSPPPYVVLTGGPGAGKSTLLDALRAAGFATVGEAGRAIIRDQTLIGGRALHTVDPLLYAELMLSWEMRSYREAAGEAATRPGPVFFDRGVPDLVGYHLLLGREVPAHVTAAARHFRYHPTVFLAPPWAEIYTHDEERKQDFAEAVRTHDAVAEGYRRHGYHLVTLPEADVATRVAVVRRQLGC